MRKIFIFILIIVFQGIILSQNTTLNLFSAGGGVFYGVNMQQSWTLGEPVIETAAGQTITFTQGFQQSDLLRTLNGQVTYDNAVHSPMTNTAILLKEDSLTIRQTSTNSIGYYEFQFLPNGNFHLAGQCAKPWGGGNAIDALLIMKHFTGMNPLSGLRLDAADVNASGNVNSVDALQVMKRFVGLLSSFPLGNWVFENHNIIVNGFSNLTDNFKGLCTGDVDGSFTPSNLKSEPTLTLTDNGVIKIKDGEDIIVPVTINENATLAALSIVLYYPEDQVSIKSVSIPGGNQNLVYNANNGELRVAWYALDPRELRTGEILLNIHLKCNLGLLSTGNALKFALGDESQLGDFTGGLIIGKTLEIPLLIKDENGFYLGQNQPNPGSELTTIKFSLPGPGNVRLIFNDILGQESKVLMNGAYIAGAHTYSLDCSNIPDGVYLYSMQYSSSGKQYSASRRMVIIH